MASLRVRRGRIIVAVALVAAGTLFTVRSFSGGDGLEHPSDPCTERPTLRTFRGVTLQPAAMRSFKKALRQAPGTIIVSQSYRSCRQQALACRNVCGDPQGCPGRCAKPGTSYHQIGAAIDITQASLDGEGVIAALERNGWCQSEPRSDPGHFSYAGCH